MVRFQIARKTDSGYTLVFDNRDNWDYATIGVVINITRNHYLQSIDFSTYDGTSRWWGGKGLVSARKWESDDQAVHPQGATAKQVFPIKLLNGPVSLTKGKRIAAEALVGFPDKKLRKALEKAMQLGQAMELPTQQYLDEKTQKKLARQNAKLMKQLNAASRQRLWRW